jgi:hypothetical protein
MNTLSSFTVEKTAVLMFVFGRVWLHNGVLQNSNVTKQYVLQNGTHYKTVHVTNGMCDKTVRVTKRYALQTGTCYKMVRVRKR